MRPGPGRRYLTELVAVAARFQRFCRDLHSEAAQRVVATVKAELSLAITKLITNNRKLDSGNANEANLGPDFGRLGMKFFAAVEASNRRNARRRKQHPEDAFEAVAVIGPRAATLQLVARRLRPAVRLDPLPLLRDQRFEKD